MTYLPVLRHLSSLNTFNACGFDVGKVAAEQPGISCLSHSVSDRTMSAQGARWAAGGTQVVDPSCVHPWRQCLATHAAKHAAEAGQYRA